FQVDLPLREVFKRPTLAELAVFIESAERSLYRAIEPLAKQAFYPVSSAQKRMLIVNQLEADTTAYNVPVVLSISGELDPQRFAQALQGLIDRHETLRTSFAFVEGEAVQRIHDTVSFALTTEQATAAEVPALVERLIRPFDLSEAPLLRAGLISVGEEEHVLVFDMHHIISDGVSMDVLVREFVALYQGATLPELRIQYKEYAAWQNKLLLSDAMKKQEAYWLDVFGDEVPVLDLPTDTTRPSHRDAAGSTHAFRLDETLTQALKELASETGTTLYRVLMAANQILLARYAGQEDIVVGSPIAGRSHADLEGLIGVFINSLTIRNRPVGEKSFADYLEEVRHTTIQAFENADYPFEMLVDQLQLQRDLSRHPLFDVMFMMQQTNETALELEGLSIRPYDAKHTQAKFDLSLHAGEVDGAIECAMQFRTSLFQPETVARMSAHLVNILQAVVAQRGLLLQDIPLLSVAEWDEVIYGFNQTDTEVPTDKLIHELFEAQVAAAPQRVAVVHQGHLLTYAELNEKANQLARVLRANGVQAESVVALVLDRSPEMIISILATLKAGGAFLPIDPSNPPERIEWILQDSGAHLLLTQSHLEQVKQLPIQRIETDASDLYSGDGSNLELAGTPSQLCYVIYTSGSTGQPKGVQIEHCSIVNYTVCLIERMGITEQD
ncbi:MAG: non-ribosomal peptide synthetase, partial [Tumebacillaceae bacterium]